MRQDIIGLGILSCPQQKKSGNEYDMTEKRGDRCEWDWRRSLFLSDSLCCDSIWSEAWDSGCQERRCEKKLIYSFKLRKEMTVITPDDIMIHKQVREFDWI